MTISVSITGMQEVLEKLAKLEQSDAKKVLKAAVNDTAKEAKTILADRAYKVYHRKRQGLNDSMTIKKATVASPSSVVYSRGRIQEPLDYKARPTTIAEQQGRKLAAKVQILRSGGLKSLEVSGRKAFLTEFKFNTLTGKVNRTAHQAIVQRKGRERLPLKTFYSPAIPVAIGSDRTMKYAEPLIRQKLARNLEKHIEEVLGK